MIAGVVLVIKVISRYMVYGYTGHTKNATLPTTLFSSNQSNWTVGELRQKN